VNTPVPPAATVGHLFRHEAGRMAAAVARLVGVGNLDLVDDVVQDSLVQAMEVWKFGRLPDNPAAWLMRAARNRAIDVIRRQRTVRRFAPEVADQLSTGWALQSTVDSAFLESEIADGELRLMFALCDGRLPAQTQVMVILKYLCGFGVPELSQAFLTGEAAVEKRLARARTTLAEAQPDGEERQGSVVEAVGFPRSARSRLASVTEPARLHARLPAVAQALYLMFSEGYHGSHPDAVVREELCAEALRLTRLLANHPVTGTPAIFALLALMCFLAARLGGRRDDSGALLPLDEQDRSRWDPALLAGAWEALGRSAAGDHLTEFHLQAAIAAKHAAAADLAATDWPGIVALYDQLFQQRPSPVVALNRAVAVGWAQGPDVGLAAVDAIDEAARLEDYLFLSATRADLLRRAGRPAEAIPHYQRARELARSEPERRFFDRRLRECGQPSESGARAPT
jgi:RNA polymerase sigma factor (sigma-70 family)